MWIQTSKAMALLVISFSVFTGGCMNANKSANQVKQQATHMQQQIPPATDNRVEVAKSAADKITKINGVKSANVLVARRNAYVAAVTNVGQTGITPQLEKQIADQVRSADPNIQNVYVSTNPEFVNRVNQYVTDVGQGRPIAGFFQEFSEMVQRIFPSAR